MEIRRYWEILLRRKRVFMVIFLTIALTAVTGTYLLTPSYEATAKISVETSTILSTLLNELEVDTERIKVTVASTASDQVDLMGDDVVKATLRPILRQLISKLQLRDGALDLIEPDELIKPSIKKLILPESFLEVEQYEDTNILEIAAISVYPEEAMLMANTLADLYIQNQINQRGREYESVRKFVQSKIGKERSKYIDALRNILEFRVKGKVVDLDTEIENSLERLSDLHSAYDDNVLAVAHSKAAIKVLENRLSGIGKFRVSFKELEDNEVLQSLKNALSEYIIELAGLRAEYQPDHPDVLQVKQRIERTKNLIRNEADMIVSLERNEIDPLYDEVVSKLVSEYTSLLSAKAEETALKKIIDRRESQLMTYPKKTMRKDQLESHLSVIQDTYEKLFGYLNRVAIAESMTFSEIRLIDPASRPDVMDPYFPRKILTCVLGFFAGLFWGVIGAFIAEYLDDTIHTSDELHEVSSLPLVGTIPKSAGFKRKLIFQPDPKSPVVEAYRLIRNNIRYLTADNPIKSLVVVSPSRGDESSAAAVNLAIAIANEGKNIAIVDLNLRNPSIHKKLGIMNYKGVVDFVTKGTSMEEIIVKTDFDNLSAVFSGESPADPARIIDSPKLKSSIEELSLLYDMVIIAGPNLVPFNDGLVLGNYADGLLVVFRSGKTTSRLLKKIEQDLMRANVKVVGIVLDRVEKRYLYH